MPKQPISKECRFFRGILLALTILTLVNVLLSASVVGLIGGILVLIMVWGIRRGDYPLTRALAIFLFLYAAANLIVLVVVTFAGAKASLSALIWLGCYSAAIVAIGVMLLGKRVQNYLKTAPQPKEKERKIHFFHGGWRDL